MALPVLDGNQSATTLSSVVTGGEHIVAHSVVCLGSTAIANITNAVSGSVVSISNFPSTQTVAGTVTANVPLTTDGFTNETGIRVIGAGYGSSLRVQGINPNTFAAENLEEGGAIPVMGYSENPLPISGTVTATNNAIDNYLISAFEDAATSDASVAIRVQGTPGYPMPVSGTVTANVSGLLRSDEGPSGDGVQIYAYDSNSDQARMLRTSDNYPTVLAVDPVSIPPISGTVTAAAPNGSLTTRFGTPTTANTAFATSAVTNANRKYLLIQNVTTGSNVITVGIGFTPTTTQGIQLTAGAGITFESSYIPTGAVYVLSSVTASNFTILEA